MSPKILYWTGFVIYGIVVIAVGLKAYLKKKRNSDGGSSFWTADRNLSATSVGLSISAGMMSISWSCVYGVQLFYWYGVSASWLLAIPWLLALAGFALLVPWLRRFQAFSQPEMIGARFGVRARQLLAMPLAFVYLIWCGAEIYAAAQVVAPMLECSFHLALLLIAAIVAIYSFLGGFDAVVATDKIQFALVAFFVITMVWLGLRALPDAPLTALTQITTPPKAAGDALSLTAAGIPLILITLVAYLPGWLVTTDVWLRLQAARSIAAARRGAFIAILNSFVFIAAAPMIIGLSALYLFPPENGAIPAMLHDGTAIFAVFMKEFSSTSLNIFLTIGLAAAAMSTIDTTGNVMALSIYYDLIEPARQHQLSAKAKILLPRLISAFAIALAFIYAIFTDSLWDIFYLSSGILTTTIFIPMAATVLPSARPLQVHAAIIAGFVSTLLFYFLESRGMLANVEPAWLSRTGIGYILWGLLTATLAFGVAGRKTVMVRKAEP